MEQRVNKGQAVMLRSVDYGDKDRIVTLLISEEGKRSAIAKGGKVSRKRFGGAFELFRITEVSYSESRKDTLAMLTEASVVQDFREIETSFDKIAFGSYATELTRELLQDGEGGREILGLLVEYYQRLEAQEDHLAMLEADLQSFILRLLALTGFAPCLAQCCLCDRHVDGGQKLVFARLGEGALCASCRRPGQAVIHTTAPVMMAMDGLSRGYPLPGVAPLAVHTLRQSRQLILAMSRAILARDLRSYKTLQMVMV